MLVEIKTKFFIFYIGDWQCNLKIQILTLIYDFRSDYSESDFDEPQTQSTIAKKKQTRKPKPAHHSR